jgi:SPX domain protein involved in polyphosphate accumulation
MDFERELQLFQVRQQQSFVLRQRRSDAQQETDTGNAINAPLIQLVHCHPVRTQDYVRLNREGIRKIVKKFDKRIGTAHQLPYVQKLKERDDTKVNQKTG